MHSPFPLYSLVLKVLPENVRRRRDRYRGFKANTYKTRKRGFFFTLQSVKRKNKKKKKITPLKQTSAEAHFQPFTPVGIAVNR